MRAPDRAARSSICFARSPGERSSTGSPAEAPGNLGWNLRLVPGRTKRQSGNWDGPVKVLWGDSRAHCSDPGTRRWGWHGPRWGCQGHSREASLLATEPSECGNPELAWLPGTPAPQRAALPSTETPDCELDPATPNPSLCWVSIQHAALATPLSSGPQFPFLSLFCSPSPGEDTSPAWVRILHSDHNRPHLTWPALPSGGSNVNTLSSLPALGLELSPHPRLHHRCQEKPMLVCSLSDRTFSSILNHLILAYIQSRSYNGGVKTGGLWVALPGFKSLAKYLLPTYPLQANISSSIKRGKNRPIVRLTVTDILSSEYSISSTHKGHRYSI